MTEKSIVKSSEELRSALKRRWKELKLTQLEVSEDAAKLGRIDIRRQSISKYLTQPYAHGALNEEQILWLSNRWMIYHQFVIGEVMKPLTVKIPRKYNEKYALERLKEIYKNEVDDKKDAPGTDDREV